MHIYLSCTANLGDFLNAMPVLSGIYNSYGPIDFIIRDDMRKFNGIKEFLMYQNIFNSVNFANEIYLYGVDIINLSSWTREDKGASIRPIETCRYENWIRDHYNFNFEVDDNFILKVQDLGWAVDDDIQFAGDRWSGPDIDLRRKTGTLAHLPGLTFLNYNEPLMINAYLIKNSKKPFISTFTGISVIADLLNVEQIVLYGDDLIDWDNKPIQYSFEKHYYANRKSKLMYIGDYKSE